MFIFIFFFFWGGGHFCFLLFDLFFYFCTVLTILCFLRLYNSIDFSSKHECVVVQHKKKLIKYFSFFKGQNIFLLFFLSSFSFHFILFISLKFSFYNISSFPFFVLKFVFLFSAITTNTNMVHQKYLNLLVVNIGQIFLILSIWSNSKHIFINFYTNFYTNFLFKF